MKFNTHHSKLITGSITFFISFVVASFGNAATTTINGCKNNATGALRIATTCGVGETALTWDAIGPPGLQGPPGASGNSVLPGATLNSLTADLQSNLGVGPVANGTCSHNPYISGATPCPPVQSGCPSGTPIKTKLSCTVLPSADINTISGIYTQVYGNTPTTSELYPSPSASIDKTNNILNCNAPGSSFPANVSGFTPWCFYKLNGGKHGIGYNYSSDPNALVMIYSASTPSIQVTQQQYNTPGNWDCFSIAIQATAQCLTIPQNVNSILKQLGISK